MRSPPSSEWRMLALYSPPHFLSYLQTSETQRYLERSCFVLNWIPYITIHWATTQGNKIQINGKIKPQHLFCERVGEVRGVSEYKLINSNRGSVSSVGRALDCWAVGRVFDSRGWTNTQGLKITEKWRYRVAWKFWGSFILQIGDFLWFAGTNFCGSRWLKFLVGTNFCDSLFK